MSYEMTGRWALPLLTAGQTQKEIFHNEALTRIDMIVQAHVESADIATPPAAPLAGQCWIVGAAPVAAWAGRAGELAAWTPAGWRFVAPAAGMRAFVADRGHAMTHDGVAWRDAAVRIAGYFIEDVQVVGARQAAIADPAGGSIVDAEARAAMGAILAALRAHGLIGG